MSCPGFRKQNAISQKDLKLAERDDRTIIVKLNELNWSSIFSIKKIRYALEFVRLDNIKCFVAL